ncbi:MAG: cell division protein FtsH, partial [Candidatus Omnitrophica bacterium]|nr:cell division protein FtsH [Candidatus Omnitrophota bacterium]
RPDVLDPALLRPGRFDRQVVIERPDIKGREEILKVHAKGVKLGPNVDLAKIARQTPGFSGADLANLVNEGALLGARRKLDFVGQPELEQSIERVMVGPERKSRVISKREKKIKAVHESGHTLIALLLPGADPVHKVSIIPRGYGIGGYTLQVPDEASDDLEKATHYAQTMVCELGMSDKLGHLTFGKKDRQVFLGRDLMREKDYSEQTAVLIDSEVRRIVDGCYARATDLLKQNYDKLLLLTDVLLEKEVIDAEEIKKVTGLQGASLPENGNGTPETGKPVA